MYTKKMQTSQDAIGETGREVPRALAAVRMPHQHHRCPISQLSSVPSGIRVEDGDEGVHGAPRVLGAGAVPVKALRYGINMRKDDLEEEE
jgi:hypothetical protein